MAARTSQLDSVVAGGAHDLDGLVQLMWRGRRLALLVTLLFVLAGTTYALLATKWYRAEVLLLPASTDATSGLLSQFGGLASLAGIKLGGSEDVESLAVLKSRGFARSFIEDQNLTPVLLADKLDSSGKQWKGPKEKWPDVRDAVKYFEREVFRVVEDRKTGLVTLAVEWKDPLVAAKWANLMAQRINAQMREKAMSEATANVAYLKAEIVANDLVALQEPTGRLLEIELQKLMLAKSNPQFSFRVVDPAQVPKKPIRPQRIAIIAVALLLGGLFSVLLLRLRKAILVPEVARQV